MLTQQEQYFRMLAAQQSPRGGGLFGAFDAAAQQAPRTRPMTDQERRTHQAQQAPSPCGAGLFRAFYVAGHQAQQGPGRKRVESRVVEPKLLTGEHNE